MTENIYLFGEINNESILPCVQKIIEVKEKKGDKNHINLYLNTTGGWYYPALALYDTIANSKVPVHVIAMGTCQSVGMLILQAGAKRSVHAHTSIMIHSLRHTIENSPNSAFIHTSEQYK
jgi:ATP-dependent protease ClpP protease subunit